jgi:hypothetical protein
MTIDESAPDIRLPMERPLFTPSLKVTIESIIREAEEEEIDLQVLYDQVYVDKPVLVAAIKKELQSQSQITLSAVIGKNPLSKGLAELVTYLAIASEDRLTIFDDFHKDTISWLDSKGTMKKAAVPRVIFKGIIMAETEKTDEKNGFSVVLITLLKGVVYADENIKLWQNLLSLQARIRDYVREIGLELIVSEEEGFAWLRH